MMMMMMTIMMMITINISTIPYHTIVELFSIKTLRLVYIITQERGLPQEFLENVVMLLTQVGEGAIQSVAPDVTMIFVRCCQMVSNDQ